MPKLFWQVLKATPIFLGVSLFLANSSIAAENTSKAAKNNRNKTFLAQAVNQSNTSNGQILNQIDKYNQQGQDQGQLVNVFQLQDVSPGDWAFEALRSLVERYGCIVGYPNRTFRGNRALSRWEFAAGLNACLNQIERLIAASEAVLREDIEKLQRLLQEFEAELAALGVRVDDLEGRVAFLEDHQFSTTTKLKGEVIISADVATGDNASRGRIDETEGGVTTTSQVNEGLRGETAALNSLSAQRIDGFEDKTFRARPDSVDDQAALSYRARLNLETSFTGSDKLTTRLESGNADSLARATGTDSARLGYDADTTDTDGSLRVDIGKLWYRTPIIDNLKLHLGAVDVDFDDISDPKNPFFESSGSGALSRFGRRNPAIYRNSVSQSLGLNWEINEMFGIDVAYMTEGANDRSEGNGIFNGDYTAAIQLNVEPTENLELAVTYARSYYPGEDVNLSGSTGTADAKRPFSYYRNNGDGTLTLVEDVPTSADRIGLQASWRINERFNLAGWFGYVNAIAEAGSPNQTGTNVDTGATVNLNRTLGSDYSSGDSTGIITAAINLAILDVGKEGSVIGLNDGIPPYSIEEDRSDQAGVQTDIPILIEGHYRFPVTKNILVTPGVYAIINPEQNSDNDAVVVGVVRTTFRF
ncbi:MAG: iron uptake porin [Prochloraceae cyanobacterium]